MTLLPRHLVATVVLGCLAAPGAALAAAPGFLPDTTVILRVDDRVTRVRDFVAGYFNMSPDNRPAADSAGRVALLEQLTNKEVLSLLALGAGHPLGFEDRLTLRQFEQRTVSNLTFQRLVADSVVITEAELDSLRAQDACEKNIQKLRLEDPATAERVRRDLLAGKLSWDEARKQNARSSAGATDLGWVRRVGFDVALAPLIFDLGHHAVSIPLEDSSGVYLYRIAGRRPVPPTFLPASGRYRVELRQRKSAARVAVLRARLRAEIGLVYDDAQIAWASGFFEKPPEQTPGAFTIRGLHAPTFALEDTGRVLARWNGGQISLGAFAEAYRQAASLQRQPAYRPEFLRERVDGVVLEPYMAQLGTKLGFDREPEAVNAVQKRREEILVEHLYQDSIMSRIYVDREGRQRYYEANKHLYFTYASARYAAFPFQTRAGADSLALRLRSGESAEAVIAEFERLGRAGARSETLRETDRGRDFFRTAFEELRPGQVAVEEAEDGGYWVVQTVSFDPGRQLPFEEADRFVSETVNNLEAERLFAELLARHRRRARIDSHPEWVMRIDLRDPMDTRE